MRLTVLGSAASYAGPGQACASHLIEGQDARVLFDCGNGSLSNLGHVLDPTRLDAVFVSHGHPDHFLDLYALQALLRYAPDGPCPPLVLFLPPGLFERMSALLSERGRLELAAAFEVREMAEGMVAVVGDLTVMPHRVKHTAESFALVASDGEVTLCYTADTAPGSGVSAAAEGADLLLAEATLPEAYRGRAPHLTAVQAGELGRDAGVGALVLTHVWPTNDRERMEKEAGAAFGGPVRVARELDTFEVIPTAAHRRERKADA